MKDKIKEFGPSNWAINNKTAIYVITVLLSIIGYSAYQNLPKENFPEITIPKIFVRTIYPGTSPQNMENLVTKQIEKQLKSTPGLKKITSNSYQDFSFITAEFNTNVDIKEAKQRVKDAVDKAKSDLPNNLPEDPSVIDINFSDLPILYVNISGDFDFMLKVVAESMDAYYDFHVNKLSQADNIGHVQSVFVMGVIKQTHQLVY
jgi:multidrug efflux pump subunit AcrB